MICGKDEALDHISVKSGDEMNVTRKLERFVRWVEDLYTTKMPCHVFTTNTTFEHLLSSASPSPSELHCL